MSQRVNTEMDREMNMNMDKEVNGYVHETDKGDLETCKGDVNMDDKVTKTIKFHDNGDPKVDEFYDKSVITLKVKYYENGDVMKETKYTNGEISSINRYSHDKKLLSRSKYINGILSRLITFNDENEKIKLVKYDGDHRIEIEWRSGMKVETHYMNDKRVKNISSKGDETFTFTYDTMEWVHKRGEGILCTYRDGSITTFGNKYHVHITDNKKYLTKPNTNPNTFKYTIGDVSVWVFTKHTTNSVHIKNGIKDIFVDYRDGHKDVTKCKHGSVYKLTRYQDDGPVRDYDIFNGYVTRYYDVDNKKVYETDMGMCHELRTYFNYSPLHGVTKNSTSSCNIL